MSQVVVCGAGIAGVSTAFHLTRLGITDVVIVDPLPPLTLTSDKSTECYRNWWPGRPMVQLMNRSIALLDQYAEESDNAFGLNRRGYLYLTEQPEVLDQLTAIAQRATEAGAGQLRIQGRSYGSVPYDPATDRSGAPNGADLFRDGVELRKHFPFVSERVVGGLHARVAGWLSAQQLGRWQLEQALDAGAAFLRNRVAQVTVNHGQIQSVHLDDGSTIETSVFVNAAGPMAEQIGQLVGTDLPLFSELHAKTGFRDHLGAIPRDAPMIIWSDPQQIEWTADEIGFLHDEGREGLIGPMPPGCHARPEGGAESPWALGLWEYHTRTLEPVWPPPFDPMYTEVVLGGLATMVPALGDYRDRLPEATVDGGYYTKTVENMPLAGQVGPVGSYVCAGLSGFGIMAACGVGELVAIAISGGGLPPWAPWFDLGRYDNAEYCRQLATSGDSGQL